jgi:3-phenylpropionate/trans-cinnamate dioxygenase ferredoxin reductase component
MSVHPREVVLVGGGLASVSAIETLRAEGYEGAIRLVSDEAELPYDRPPLSKGYLSGESDDPAILLHDAQWYADMRVDLLLGEAVSAVYPAARTLRLAGGRRLSYERLRLATGAAPRALPPGVADPQLPLHVLRSRTDAQRLRLASAGGRSVAVIGGGVIGMEAAATLVRSGCHVTVLEAAERVMARFLPPSMSAELAQLHAAQGVEIRTGVQLSTIQQRGGAFHILLSDGTRLGAEVVLVGIGVVPNVALAADAGLRLRIGGIEVDACAQTSAPGVYACGDVATFAQADGSWARWENWTHARLHAAHAARHMLGQGAAYDEIPWVWSDQYDFNLQVLGRCASATALVTRGSMASGRLAAFHMEQGLLVGATLLNEGRHKASVRKLMAKGARIAPEQLADPAVDLKKLAAAL